MKHAIIHTDGGARGNPGPAGIGIVIEIDGKRRMYKKYIGNATNNQAEYQALLFALNKAKEIGVDSADVYLDSELVVNQLNRKFKVKDKDLASLFVKVWNQMMKFKNIKFKHIFREDNKLADKLVNDAIDLRK